MTPHLVFRTPQRPMAEALEPERDALLRLLVWRFTFGAQSRTPGQALQNLRISGAPDAAPLAAGTPKGSWRRSSLLSRVALLELLLAVLLPWLLDRLRARASAHRWAEAEAGSPRRVLWRVLNASESAAKVAQLLGTLSLLGFRRPYAPVHLLTGARVRYATIGAPAFALAFEFVGQQLLWDALSEHASFAANLAPSRASIRALARRGARAASALLGAVGLGNTAPRAHESDGADAALGKLRCAECGASPPVMPCRARADSAGDAPGQPSSLLRPAPSGVDGREAKDACGHVHCYACLSAALAADSQHVCRVCARRVRNISRVVWER